MNNCFYLKAFFFVFAAPFLAAQNYPQIKRLLQSDVVFKQFEDEVREGRRIFVQAVGLKPVKRLSTSDWAERLSLYSYKTHKDDPIDSTIQSLASRCIVTQAAIATLNRIGHSTELGERTLLLPTISGLFVPAEPLTDMEQLLASARDSADAAEISVAGVKFFFFPGDDWTPTERAFFFSNGRFIFPLRNYTLTSRFGSRVSPVTGAVRFHGGLDLAAPSGTDVYASAAGTVAECNENSVYGKYVILSHEDGWTSLYGHLSLVSVTEKERLEAGMPLGKVGSTGQSTGPHLHFELRQNGRAADPQPILKKR